MDKTITPALTKNSTWSQVYAWMAEPAVEGASLEDRFVSRVLRYLGGIFETPLENAITSRLTKSQLERARQYAAAKSVSLLEAVMSLPMVTEEQLAEADGQLVVLYRRRYALMWDINAALEYGFVFDRANRRPHRSDEEVLISSPMLSKHLRRAILLTLVNPNWPLPGW